MYVLRRIVTASKLPQGAPQVEYNPTSENVDHQRYDENNPVAYNQC